MDRCVKSQIVRLSKIEVARRQIESAIWLWFVDDDIVSVHTLAAAAHRTLVELANLWGASAWPATAAYLPKRTQSTRRLRTDDAVSFFNDVKEEETYELSQQWIELFVIYEGTIIVRSIASLGQGNYESFCAF